MIFIFILIFGVLFLFVNLRQVAPGNKGSVLAGILVVLLPICFIFRDMFWASLGQAFLSVWLCEALLLYICWWIFRLCRRIALRRPMPQRVTVVAARVLLLVSFAVTGVMCVAGYSHNTNYILREATVEVSRAPRNFTALFFSDLHMDPLIRREKVERMVREADSLKPDLILFGGDFADVHDSVLTNQGYDTLFAKFAAAARVGAFAAGGNHEAYMERDGSDIAGFLQRGGWVYLDDATACTEVACVTGRTDFQMARAREMDRKPLALLEPEKKIPWLLIDHQPKGIEPGHSGRLPDFALSGHTHDGQFFPGTVIINWVWRLACGFGTLDSVRWLVSSGVDSWGPPVRVGSDTEMWFLHFVVGSGQ